MFFCFLLSFFSLVGVSPFFPSFVWSFLLLSGCIEMFIVSISRSSSQDVVGSSFKFPSPGTILGDPPDMDDDHLPGRAHFHRPHLELLGMRSLANSSSTSASLLHFVREKPKPSTTQEHTAASQTSGRGAVRKEEEKSDEVFRGRDTTNFFGDEENPKSPAIELAETPVISPHLDAKNEKLSLKTEKLTSPSSSARRSLIANETQVISDDEEGIPLLLDLSPVRAKEPWLSSPQQPASPGPWWKSLLHNNLGSKIYSILGPNNILPPLQLDKRNLQSHDGELQEEEGSIKKGKRIRGALRKELPGICKAPNVKDKKPSLKKAVNLLRNKLSRNRAAQKLEEDFFANSSRASKASKRNTVETILKAVAKGDIYPVSVHTLRMLASTLKETGYKSANAYVTEAKIAHIEKGHEWSQLLERNYRLCLTAVNRGKGPRKKAPEVQEDAWAIHDLHPNPNSPTTRVRWATHLFAVAVQWMMRELEIAALHTGLVHLNPEDRTVMVSWESSKNDTSAAGTRRVLKCICDGDCDMRCPYEVLAFLVKKAKEVVSHPHYLAVDGAGQPVSKAAVVGSWQYLYGPSITGHSGSRSGALQYIRKGRSISQVAFLGRWKSNIIQTMAVNVGDKFGAGEADLKLKGDFSDVKVLQASVPACPEVKLCMVEDLKKKIRQLKSGRRLDKVALKKSVKELEGKMNENRKYLPTIVISQKLQVAHYNTRSLLVSPSALWKTLCGWQYYHSNYVFADDVGTMVVCQKCMGLAQSKEVKVAKPP